MRTRVVGAAALIAAALTGCDTRPAWDREGRGRGYYDVTGDFVHAGVSMRSPPDLPPLDPSAFGSDTTSRAFHLYRMRCAACHEPPDPARMAPSEWASLIERMKDKTGTAGLIPMTDAEADTILDLLRRHGRR